MNYGRKDNGFQSEHASLCYSCIVCDCEWIRSGSPVPGWTAVPSRQAQYRNKGGVQVLACPKAIPMPIREGEG